MRMFPPFSLLTDFEVKKGRNMGKMEESVVARIQG